MLWFTSDTHFSHSRIIEYCNRPFGNVEEMNQAIVDRFNSVIQPEDTLYHLGDVALGKMDESLSWVNKINGHKILLAGNHDRLWPWFKGQNHEMWHHKYVEAGFEAVHLGTGQVEIWRQRFLMCHFPYVGDSRESDRYVQHRPVDNGIPLIHGHTHSAAKYSESLAGTTQIHVGVDAWNFYPVSAEDIQEIMYL